jgi:hypothetical protein
MRTDLLTEFSGLDIAALSIEHGVSFDAALVQPVGLDSLGPAVEIACRAQVDKRWSKYAKVSLPAQIAIPLRASRRQPLRTFFHADGEHTVGFMCLAATGLDDFKQALLDFDIRARTAMRFKKNVGQSKALVCGAIGEIVDNVFEHSEKPDSGILGFHATASYFDLCVADAGVGVLKSLRQNPAYAYLSDASMALSLAVRDGTSRFPTVAGGEGRGHGFSTLFRGLNSLDAEIRLRSDNYALEVSGKTINERAPGILQKAQLPGLIVTFRTYF